MVRKITTGFKPPKPATARGGKTFAKPAGVKPDRATFRPGRPATPVRKISTPIAPLKPSVRPDRSIFRPGRPVKSIGKTPTPGRIARVGGAAEQKQAKSLIAKVKLKKR